MKIKSICVYAAAFAVLMIGCAPRGFDRNGEITLISREDGSGTRGAFIELFGIEKTNAAGEKIDYTVDSADITNSTSVMITSVAQNRQAIGYISLGSLSITVKALRINGAEPSAANIRNGTYPVFRPFNITVKDGLSPAAQDFIDFILSQEGQRIVVENGYIAIPAESSYAGTKTAGRIVVAGSSSVTPVMEKLKEAYLKINTNAAIEIQQSDSTTGVTNTVEGICDIGMVSRDIKESELAKGITSLTIAQDGIVVIVNLENPVNNLTIDQVQGIYTGNFVTWSDVTAP
ncbi:MAG: substrate-binding domain-containing protein [Spirochaetaceae bacterium]|nr:substrate-binding domain-containing protein [Spirochaetaceae bacterium]